MTLIIGHVSLRNTKSEVFVARLESGMFSPLALLDDVFIVNCDVDVSLLGDIVLVLVLGNVDVSLLGDFVLVGVPGDVDVS